MLSFNVFIVLAVVLQTFGSTLFDQSTHLSSINNKLNEDESYSRNDVNKFQSVRGRELRNLRKLIEELEDSDYDNFGSWGNFKQRNTYKQGTPNIPNVYVNQTVTSPHFDSEPIHQSINQMGENDTNLELVNLNDSASIVKTDLQHQLYGVNYYNNLINQLEFSRKKNHLQFYKFNVSEISRMLILIFYIVISSFTSASLNNNAQSHAHIFISNLSLIVVSSVWPLLFLTFVNFNMKSSNALSLFTFGTIVAFPIIYTFETGVNHFFWMLFSSRR